MDFFIRLDYLENLSAMYKTPFKADRVENDPSLVCREEKIYFSNFCGFLLFMYSKQDICILNCVLYQYLFIYACILRLKLTYF